MTNCRNFVKSIWIWALIAATCVEANPIGVCIRNCAQCKKMFGPYFEGQLCADACVKFKGKMIPDCEDISSIAPFLRQHSLMTPGLDPNAPIFTPSPRNTMKKSSGALISSSPRNWNEPQCSRYSRRSVRQPVFANSPRPILGTKIPFPRPILGRKEEPIRDEADEYIGKEFRNLNRGFQKMKIREKTSDQKQGEKSFS